MKRTLRILFGFLALILIIWLLSKWQGVNWQKNFMETTGFQPTEEISYSPSKKGYEGFISPDGNLMMKYPADWLTIKEGSFLETTVPEDWQENYDLETLFLGQKIQGDGLTQIIVYQGNFDFSIEEIIEKMFSANREQGWQVEIINSEIGEKTGTLEARYSSEASYHLHSREKIIKDDGQNTYLISFIAPDDKWENFAQEADFIMNSVVILDKTP